MILSEKHYEAMRYMLEGSNISEISKLCNVSRTAIYNWLSDDDFKAELNRQSQEIKTNAVAEITNKVGCYVKIMHEIATTSKNDKERRSACEYMIDKVLGKSTTRVADVTEEEDKNSVEDIDAMIRGLEKEIV